MKPKEILVFGATGQIGRHLLRYLTRKNFKVTVVTRNIHRKAYILKSQANAGWLNIVEMDKPDHNKLSKLFKNKDICINLIGILNEKNKSSFDNIHHLFPMKLAELAKECDSVDPIDWGQLNISEEEAFNLMAMHMAELEDNVLTLKATCVKLMVENFVLNLKLLGRK